MLDLLSKTLGPSRAVTVYVFLSRFGIGILLVVLFVAGIGTFLVLQERDQLEHVDYLVADVLEVAPLTSANQIGVMVDLRLPDGELLKLTEAEGAISATLTDKACVEVRRQKSDGALSHRLRLPHRCGS